jgi:hypothetical protein
MQVFVFVGRQNYSPILRKTIKALQLNYDGLAQMPPLGIKTTTTLLRQGCFEPFLERIEPLQSLFLSDERTAACDTTTTA